MNLEARWLPDPSLNHLGEVWHTGLGSPRFCGAVLEHTEQTLQLGFLKVHILEDGRITQTGTPDDLRRRPATPYVAALTGLNLLSGQNSGGLLTLDATSVTDGGGATLQSADTGTNGAVLITIHPNAIALHAEQPHGSPRNTWQTTVAALEPLGDITRVTLRGPLELFADITPGAAAALELRAGSEVWVSIKATEISLDPA